MRTYIVAKTLVFNGDGKLLVLRRSADDVRRPGGFDLPGGQVEEGEGIEDGAVREAFEETGLRLQPHSLQLVFAETKAGYNTTKQTDANLVKLIFAVRSDQADIVLSHEHDDFQWLRLDDPAIGRDYPALTKVLEHIRANDIAHELWSVK